MPLGGGNTAPQRGSLNIRRVFPHLREAGVQGTGVAGLLVTACVRTYACVLTSHPARSPVRSDQDPSWDLTCCNRICKDPMSR